MMESSHNLNELEPVLLSYKLPGRQRVLLLALAALLLSVFVMCLRDVVLCLVTQGKGVDWFLAYASFLCAYLLLELRYVVLAIACTKQGITITTARYCHVTPWNSVVGLMRATDLTSRFDNADMSWLFTENRRYLLYLDRHTRASLTEVLREYSSAGIIGFR